MKLSAVWQTVCGKYQPVALLGQGTFGQVLKARELATGKFVAIKLIRNVFRTSYESRKVLREI